MTATDEEEGTVGTTAELTGEVNTLEAGAGEGLFGERVWMPPCLRMYPLCSPLFRLLANLADFCEIISNNFSSSANRIAVQYSQICCDVRGLLAMISHRIALVLNSDCEKVS